MDATGIAAREAGPSLPRRAGGLPVAGARHVLRMRHEPTQFETVMNAVRIRRPLGPPRRRPRALAGDKGYSHPRIRRRLSRQAVRAVIPQRSGQQACHRGRPLSFDRESYRRRNVIECCIRWLRECRRTATRFEKLALNFLAMVRIAIMQRYLRLLLPDRA